MAIVYLANVEASKTDGIYKKIKNHSITFSKLKNQCILITKKDQFIRVTSFENGEIVNIQDLSANIRMNNMSQELIEITKKIILEVKPEYIYIRHMVPSLNLITLLSISKKKGINILYEIPTYPYFGEQIKATSNKVRTITRIMYEAFCWPIIYYFIDKLVVIKSNEDVKIFKKMVQITNGINSEYIPIKQNIEKKNKFIILGLGTIYGYHGYDKVLLGIRECNGCINGEIVEFHLVGESKEYKKLKVLAAELGIESNIVFHQKKYGEELDDIFNKADVGMGCLALHRRNANIDTTLKVVEYTVRGLPFVTSGKVKGMEKLKKTFLEIINDDTPLNINKVYTYVSEISDLDLKENALLAREIYSWDYIYKSVIDK